MSLALTLVTAIVVVATAILSGIFGMAGGIVLMGYLVWVLPVGAAMMLHGVTQATSNGYRAVLNREHIRWGILLEYFAGAVLALAILAAVAFVPDKATVFLALGMVPFVAWALPDRLALNITRRGMPLLAGVVITAVNLVAGVAGPLLDVFYVRTDLTRHEVVASKAVTQTVSHLMKLVYFGLLAGAAADGLTSLPWWIFVMVVPLAMIGTTLGKRVLDAISDTDFRRWSQWIVLTLGAVFIARGAWVALA